ncbi:phosphatidate cytidylyltransferase 1-like [Anneissia japonica]|uniref:phosphatidate cytidylyltransferase 1-like n=1 Tax=Anneissia japonica TaxID=1529436 RepID=UPI0014259C56|nr:phosphatidate cytidylyltransferase 1-like [Anneissia japonica]
MSSPTMSELRHRDGQITEKKDDEPPSSGCVPENVGLPVINEPPIPAQKDNIPTILKGLPQRWQNWVIRGFFSLLLILGYVLIIWMGPVALTCLVLLIETMCFHEIISIGYAVYRSKDLPWFRSLSWYFLLCANYFVYGQSLKDYFGIVLHRDFEMLQFLIDYYRIISFMLYIFGFIFFVLSLVKNHYLVQFTLFGWTHIGLLIVVSQSNLLTQTIFEGLIWFIISTLSVICNDIMAYMFGFFFGRTSLIKLSPKKTWEGFIGALFSTLVFAFFLAAILAPHPYLTCPATFNAESHSFVMKCTPSSTFVLKEYHLPTILKDAFAILGFKLSTVTLYPAQLHAVVIAAFASLVGPFGGFFASGFKRAFKIKDFGDVIPGHGGIMDRFDCQFIMASFLYVYIFTFLKTANPQKLIQQLFQLPVDDQMTVYNSLQEHLMKSGALTP